MLYCKLSGNVCAEEIEIQDWFMPLQLKACDLLTDQSVSDMTEVLTSYFCPPPPGVNTKSSLLTAEDSLTCMVVTLLLGFRALFCERSSQLYIYRPACPIIHEAICGCTWRNHHQVICQRMRNCLALVGGLQGP